MKNSHRKLDDGIPKPWEAPLMTDEYEYTSGDVGLMSGRGGEIVESYYFRKLMPGRGFHVFMGLQHFLAFVENFNDTSYNCIYDFLLKTNGKKTKKQ